MIVNAECDDAACEPFIPTATLELVGASVSGDVPNRRMGMKGGKPRARPVPPQLVWGALGVLAVVVLVLVGGKAGTSNTTQLSVLTWNVAAINNNPFEYWITHHDAAYNQLMADVQTFISDPGERDVPVERVFTEAMFGELKASMTAAGWAGVDDVEARWHAEYKGRKIISQFMKDPVLGKKRLASMPDRVTNTINAFDARGAPTVAMRPTVINCYSGADLGDGAKWWAAWRAFVFDTPLNVKGRDGAVSTRRVYEMFSPIKRSKYPAISEEEERVSLPLQTLAGAIFDAILVHMLNTVAPAKWQPLRADMCDKLNRRKVDRTVEVLESYAGEGAEVLFLQEVAAGAFVAKAKGRRLGDEYHFLQPAKFDPDRDQNSLVLLSKRRFPNGAAAAELTPEIMGSFAGATDANGKAVPVADGDLLAVSATDFSGRGFVFASFHGDTNGLATIPVVGAVHDYVQRPTSALAGHTFVFGLDANTCESHAPPRRRARPPRAREPRAASREPAQVRARDHRPAGRARVPADARRQGHGVAARRGSDDRRRRLHDVQRAHVPAAAAEQGGRVRRQGHVAARRPQPEGLRAVVRRAGAARKHGQGQHGAPRVQGRHRLPDARVPVRPRHHVGDPRAPLSSRRGRRSTPSEP